MIPFLVRLKGFEPPTYWFVASHSIQLSYSRISLALADDLISIAELQPLCKPFFQFSSIIFQRDLHLLEEKEKVLSFDNTFSGTAEGIRTPDLLVRSQSLYPTELQPHTAWLSPDSLISIAESIPNCKSFLQFFEKTFPSLEGRFSPPESERQNVRALILRKRKGIIFR